jgi:hypothetical protein
MQYTQKAQRLIFNTQVMDRLLDIASVMDATAPTAEVNLHRRTMRPNVIIMSRDTFREILREDCAHSYVGFPYDKTKPETVCGVRVAFDQAMGLGEMAVAEAHFA